MVFILYLIFLSEYSSQSSIHRSAGPQGYSPTLPKLVYVINFEIKDTQEDATVGARSILQMAQQLQPIFHAQSDGQTTASFDSIIFSFQEKFPELNICYAIFFT